MRRFAALDLSEIAPPDIIETLSFELILDEIIADFKARFPEYNVETLESDPIIKAFEVCATRELQIRARVNDAARAVMLASAQKGDLEQLAALFQVKRAQTETDDRFKWRTQLAPEGFVGAGPEEGIKHHALTASEHVSDVAVNLHKNPIKVTLLQDALSELDGEVLELAQKYIYEGAIDADKTLLIESHQEARIEVALFVEDEALFTEVLRAVHQRLNDEGLKNATDVIYTQGAIVTEYDLSVKAYVRHGPDAGVIEQNMREAVLSFAAERKKFERPVYLNSLISTLLVNGIETVEILTPETNLIPKWNEVFSLRDLNIELEVLR